MLFIHIVGINVNSVLYGINKEEGEYPSKRFHRNRMDRTINLQTANFAMLQNQMQNVFNAINNQIISILENV